MFEEAIPLSNYIIIYYAAPQHLYYLIVLMKYFQWFSDDILLHHQLDQKHPFMSHNLCNSRHNIITSRINSNSRSRCNSVNKFQFISSRLNISLRKLALWVNVITFPTMWFCGEIPNNITSNRRSSSSSNLVLCFKLSC